MGPQPFAPVPSALIVAAPRADTSFAMDAHDLLRSARLARGLSVDQIIAQTRMSPRVVYALDEGRFADVPAGLYARSYLRAFAAVVGLDRDAVERIAPLLPDAADPLPVIRDIVLEQETREARVRKRALRTLGAAVVDAIALLGIGVAAFASTARIAGTNGAALANASAIPLALVFVALAAIYFLLLAGISGDTIGTRLFHVQLVARATKLDLRSIGRRAARAWMIEASMLATIGETLAISKSEVRASMSDWRPMTGRAIADRTSM